MGLSIIDQSNKVPGAYIEVLFGVGPRSAGDEPRKILILGNKTSTGTWVAGKIYEVPGDDDARTGGGGGSELFLMARAVRKVFPGATLYAGVVAESAGTNATDTITYTGPATASGSTSIYVLGEQIDVPIASGDSVTVIAAAVRDAINAKTDWPVTASAAVGVCTVTARHKGPRGNHISLRATAAATGVGVTVATPYLATGATSDDPQAVLDAAAPTKYSLIVCPYDDATNVAKFKTHVLAWADPLSGRRQQVVCASIGSLATTVTLAKTNVNSGRVQVVWHFNADDTPAMIAAAQAGLRAEEESADPAANLDGLVLTGIKPQTNDVADRPLATELKSALDNGITPLAVAAGGDVYLVRSITSRCTDAAGNADYSVLDTSKVTVPDFIADDIEVKFAGEFANFKLAPDDPEGAPDPGVVTPKMVRDWLYGLLTTYQDRDQLVVRVTELEPNLVVEMATAPAGRINASIPVDVIEGFHQFAASVRQVG